MTFYAGAYTAQLSNFGGSNDITLGQIADGFNVEWRANKQLITGDNYALSPQDAVYQGMEVFVSFKLMESELLRARLAYWPYLTTGSGATLQGVYGTEGVAGRLDVESSIAQELTLTGTATTTSEGSVATMTFARACIAENVPIRIKFGPSLRDVALRMRVYPNDSGVYYTFT